MTSSPSDDQGGNRKLRLATLRSLTGGALESMTPQGVSTPKRKELVDRYNSVVEKVQVETAKAGPNVIITVQDRDASILQSKIAEAGNAGRALPTGGLEAQFGEGLTGGDIMGWILSTLDHIDPTRWHAIMRPPDGEIGSFADSGRVAVIGDWGTNLYGAPVSAASIARDGGYELLLHLGDIYYSGTSAEVKERFLKPWPTGAGKVSRALNGNHEMYSGGFAYFEDILPHFKQTSSYFAFQNGHWLLIGLDTAHTDHAIDDIQARWLNKVVQDAGGRKVILFSHHQPFSRLSGQGPNLQSALAGLFQKQAITAWYWGHEHECIIYDRQPDSNLLGRCIGHGGIPSPRKSAVRSAPTSHNLGGIAWKRLSAGQYAPPSIVLDGRNPLVPGEEDKFGPHGYLTLDFDGPKLIERVHLPDGTAIYQAAV
jgi:calcineurin-like phosphoesterase family protein